MFSAAGYQQASVSSPPKKIFQKIKNVAKVSFILNNFLSAQSLMQTACFYKNTSGNDKLQTVSHNVLTHHNLILTDSNGATTIRQLID